MEWTTPEKLFVCLSKLEAAHGQRLLKTYTVGSSAAPEIEAIRREHLRYVYELGEKGISWAGGALGQFAGTLSVYAVNSLEEAKKARQNDPYYQKGMLYGDKYHEWIIHMPFIKASPAHREKLRQGMVEAGIDPSVTKRKADEPTPEKLFVCLYKSTPAHAQKAAKTFGKGGALSAEETAIRHKHLRYVCDLGERGITWASGTFADGSGGLSVYAVNSVEEAKKAKENDPYYLAGYWIEPEYHQWFIHMPLSKAVPERREKLRQSLINFGIIPG